MEIITSKNYDDMSRKAANIVAAQITMKDNSVLGLATGSTPIGMYKCLIEWFEEGYIDFSNIKTVNLDEYYGLSPEHCQSYRYFMNANLFDHVNIDKNNTHVPNGMAFNTDEECEKYDCLINYLGGTDLQVLGLGHNGHIGFNEPNNVFERSTHLVTLNDTTIKANVRFFSNEHEVPQKAVTMGMGAIMQSKKILLVVSGKDKSQILCRSLFGSITPEVPASILQLHPQLVVVCDDEALSEIKK